ncbi:MAG: four helix bundle protein [Chloroflexota bacterium]
MKYQEWEATVPEAIRGDSLWKAKVYRLALFSCKIGWHDVTNLFNDRRTRSLSDQLYRALGSISANIAEGYSRSSSKERAHFYEYALGSTREARDWYYKAGDVLTAPVIAHSIMLLSEIIRMLLVMIPDQRGTVLKEETIEYQIDLTDASM